MADSKYSKHRDDPKDFLGLDNDQFNSYMQQLAFTSPQAYLAVRHRLYEAMIKGVITDIDDLVYDVMTEGKVKDTEIIDNAFVKTLPTGAQELFRNMEKSLGSYFRPRVSRAESNDVTMSICKTLKEAIQNYVVERIMVSSQVDSAMRGARRHAELGEF